MPERRPRLSRRRMLQVSGLAPLVALMTSGASDDAVAAEALCVSGADPDDFDDVARKAKNHKQTVDEPKFRKVAAVLWAYFQAGTCTQPAKQERKDLIDAAWKKEGLQKRKSGELIVENLDKWTWNPETGLHEPRTDGCAYLCGTHARKRAAGGPITVKIFNQAWDDTEQYVWTVFSRAEAFADKQGTPIHIQGYGC